MPVQDDARELELVRLFNLRVPPDRSRSDTDAYLHIDGRELAFELKSTTSGSVSTVRDFGAEHIRKWRDKHWIFGFYDRTGTTLLHCHYASPSDMAPWIEGKQRYVLPDLILGEDAPASIDAGTLIKFLGDKPVYSYENARWIMKNQWGRQRYRDAEDVEGGYSQQRMVEILRERCAYVIRRGATLNNPHIERSYFAGWEQITEEHASRLRQLVRGYLASDAAKIDMAWSDRSAVETRTDVTALSDESVNDDADDSDALQQVDD